MPIYIYQNESTGEIKEIIQGMNDEHTYSEGDVKWNRLYTSPLYAIDSKIDCNSAKDFVEKTRKKRGTLGNLFDQSRELSEKRAQNGGDALKEAYYDRYKKIRGRDHNDIGQVKAKEKLSKMGVDLV